MPSASSSGLLGLPDDRCHPRKTTFDLLGAFTPPLHSSAIGDALSDDELAALVSAGIAEPLEQCVSIEVDEAVHGAFFSGLIAQVGTCPQPAGA